jgi:Carboxypeptidase regulatory-like domain
MVQKLGLTLGLLVLALGVGAHAQAAAGRSAISGYVRNTAGLPQMGAAVEVISSAVNTLKVFTDDRGFYSAGDLKPGTYSIKVSAASFLPSLREKVDLRAGANAVVNVTLNTLFEAIQWPVRAPSDDKDDWKWVLRTAANRPILRALPDGTEVVASEGADHDLKGTLSFMGGSEADGFGSSSDMSTGFSVEKSIFSSGTLAVGGNVGYGSGSPTAVLRVTYEHRMPNGSTPKIGFTARRLPAPMINGQGEALQALALTTSDDFVLGDTLELHFGSELQTIQFLGRVAAARPFGSVDFHLSPDTVVEYRYASSEPDSREEKGFDSAPADLSESGPRVSLAHFRPELERAHHQEVSISHREGKISFQFAGYLDRVVNPALSGVGEASGENVLPDIYSETFTYRGKDLNAAGMRMVLQRKLRDDMTATLDYSYGGVLDLGQADTRLSQVADSSVIRNRHALAGKLSGTIPKCKTKWTASYRYVSGQALTPVDMFSASPGQTDPYLSFFVRQPIPGTHFLPGHMDAIIDVRNLLAQGYVPVLGQDGRTLYLVDSARSVRGGVAFTF